jgi:capsular exopolysaccharide synthesis family protein
LISRRPGKRGRDERPVGTLTGPTAETYRRLATNIEFLDPDTKICSIVVTSSMPGEGKTTTAINLALAAGELAPRVLLVDADLRRPSVAKYCGIEGAVGLTSVLSGQVSLEDAVQSWSHISVLTAGTLPPNPSQIVNSNAMADLLVKLSRSFDLVIVDSPPLLPVTDALALSRITDGALVVVRYKATRRQQLSGSLRALEAVKARAIGVVLNRVTQKNKDTEYVYEGSSEPRQKTLRPPVFRGGGKKSASAGAHARRRESNDERTPAAPGERVTEPSER